jgi:hypothetical protein
MHSLHPEGSWELRPLPSCLDCVLPEYETLLVLGQDGEKFDIPAKRQQLNSLPTQATMIGGDCAVLCSHVLNIINTIEASTDIATAATVVRVQLHEARGGKMHISVQQCSGSILLNDVFIRYD